MIFFNNRNNKKKENEIQKNINNIYTNINNFIEAKNINSKEVLKLILNFKKDKIFIIQTTKYLKTISQALKFKLEEINLNVKIMLKNEIEESIRERNYNYYYIFLWLPELTIIRVRVSRVTVSNATPPVLFIDKVNARA